MPILAGFEGLDGAAAVERILGSRSGFRVRHALLLVLEGVGYRRAAHAAGLSDHRDVFRAARRLGLRELHLARKRGRDAMTYSGRDLAATLALREPSKATLGQACRASNASSKRLELLQQGARL